MKIEFLIDKSEYKKILSKDKFDKQIEFRNEKVKGKNNYLLTLECSGKSVSTAKKLSESRIAINKLFADNNIKYRLLTEEASQFFVQRLYPYASNFETKLRKFIYTALFDIDEKAEALVVEKYKITISKKIGDKLPLEDFLTYSDLGQIFDFLFSNDEFLEQIKKINTQPDNFNRRLTKSELIKKVESIEEKTIWNLLFAPVFTDSILPNIYREIQNYRNDIMHIHYISYSEYTKSLKTYICGIKDINYQISKGIVIEDTKSNIDSLASNLVFIRSMAERMQAISAVTSDLLKPIAINYINSMQPLMNALQPISSQLSNYYGHLNGILSTNPLQTNSIVHDLSQDIILNSHLLGLGLSPQSTSASITSTKEKPKEDK